MQIIKIKSFIVALSVMFLAGCNEALTKEYLLQHPRVLHKEFERCQNNTTNVAYCDQVVEAAQEFVKLSNDLAENPQGFGQQIIKAESQLAELEQKKHDGQGKDNIGIVEQAYDAQAHHVKVLLAVVAEASSPGAL